MSSVRLAPALDLPLDGVGEPADARTQVLRLFDENATGLRRYARSAGLTTDEAEDVVQEAFLSLFRHLRGGGSQANLHGWLVVVTHRLSLKQRERRARRDRREAPLEPAATHMMTGTDDDPEAILADGRRRRRLRAVVRALPARDRQCLYLRAEGLPYRDIARTLGVSLGTVAKLLARSVLRLSNAIQE
jgi:RNA polymerase sigma-70 factor, ECF subfamily